MVVLVERRTIMRNDRWGSGEYVGSRGWTRRGGGGVASSHAGVGRGASAGERGCGGSSEAIGQGLIVEEERTLVDEALDDCLVGAGGS